MPPVIYSQLFAIRCGKAALVGDQAGRYGGDKFCVILPDVPLSHAAELMDTLRERFSRWMRRSSWNDAMAAEP